MTFVKAARAPRANAAETFFFSTRNREGPARAGFDAAFLIPVVSNPYHFADVALTQLQSLAPPRFLPQTQRGRTILQ